MWVCNGPSASLVLPNGVQQPSAKMRLELALGGILQRTLKFLQDSGLPTGTVPLYWVMSKHGPHSCWQWSVDGTFITPEGFLSLFFYVFVLCVVWQTPGDTGHPVPAVETPPLGGRLSCSRLPAHTSRFCIVWHTFSLAFPSLPILFLCLWTTHPFWLWACLVFDSPVSPNRQIFRWGRGGDLESRKSLVPQPLL